MSIKKILVAGATGKQGGSLIEALLANHAADFSIYGITRNAASNSATRLAARNVRMIEGKVENPGPIFEQIGKDVWGVFSVTVPGKNEEEQAKPLIDAAIANGVQHFIFTSADRGGPSNSNTDPTPVPHFITKFNIETHLKAKAAASPQKMAWTILRPVAFYENLTPDFIGKSFAQMVKQLGGMKLNMIGTEDIGKVAAQAFQNPEKYRNKAVTLAADTLDFDTMNRIFKEEVGIELPLAPGIVASFIKWMVVDLGKMFEWFKAGNYSFDISEMKAEHPGMQDFRSWLRNSSKFETKQKV